MDDFRHNTSSVIWCSKDQALMTVKPCTVIMKTVFKLHTDGVYPMCVCPEEELPGSQQQSKRTTT